MLFRTIAILAAVFLLANPVASKRDMHIEHTAPITVAGGGFNGGLK